jgi:hypothetical protein
MDLSRLNTGEKLAGAAGIALLLIMFIFDWFSIDVGGGVVEIDAGGNAWQWFGFIDIVLFLAAVAGIALAVVAATRSDVDLPITLSAITAGIGILALLLVIYRIIDPPGGDAEAFGVDVGRDIGVWLGLIATAGVAAGGWLAMQEEGTSFGDVGRDDAGAGTGGTGGTGGTAGTAGSAPPPPPPPPPSGTGGQAT